MTYFGAVRHSLTENHHVIVDGVHTSVHILNEQLYRKLSYPLQLTYWANSQWNRSWLVKKLVRLVQNGKEPFFTSSPTKLLEYWTGSALLGILSSLIIHRLKKGVSVSVFVTVTSRKPEYPQTEL